MKVPRRINDILRRQSEYIESRTGELGTIILKYQDRLLREINQKIIPELEVVNGVIVDSVRNMRLLQSLDKVYEEFGRKNYPIVARHVIDTTDKIKSLSKDYFSISLGVELPDYFDKAIKTSSDLIDMRIGADVSGGFLPKLIKNDALLQSVKAVFAKGIIARSSLRMMIKDVTDIIAGVDKEGGLEYQVRRYAHDLYRQYNAAYNDSLARQIKLKYFIYQNGLVLDSRDFCVVHDGKVWSRDEAKEWPKWTPAKSIAKGEFPETVNGKPYKIKQKDLTAVPGYISYPGYNPVVDIGGYNCRHILAWISDNLAFKLRPELKKDK